MQNTSTTDVDMNMQEILDSLVALEKELQNIKSARVLVEETVTSYKLTQKEIANLLEVIKNADESLLEVIKCFQSQNLSFSDNLQQGVQEFDKHLAAIGKSFQEKCDKSNAGFDNKVAQAIGNLQQKTTSLLEQFDARNASLQQCVHEISELRSSFASTIIDAIGINKKLIDLQKNLADWLQRIYAGLNKISTFMADKNEIDARLNKIETLLTDESNARKNSYAVLQKSSRRAQAYLIITILLVIIAIAYPILREYLKI